MKQSFRWALAACVTLLLTACGSNTPAGVAEKAVEHLKKNDYKGYVELVYIDENEKKEDREKLKQEYVMLLESKMKGELEKKGGIKEYKTLSETVQDSVAEVKMNIVYGNQSTEEETMNFKKDKSGEWKIDSGK